MLYFISKVVNNHKEFRMALTQDGEVFFDELFPCYTVFHKDTELLSNIWTEYSNDYETFCKSYQKRYR